MNEPLENTGALTRIPTIERYKVVEQLGRGGMGIVVKAQHAELDKVVAIKILNAGLVADENSLQRFKIEAKAGSKLSHPNLVSIFDFGVANDGSPYIVMEYIEGKSLHQVLAEKGPLPEGTFLTVFEQVTKALQYIHNQGIVHRDVKSSNIMLETIEGELYAKLVDFGIAKVLAESGGTVHHLTETGSVFGSPLYMSPEQCQGLAVDARSDIYSLGCVMYECISGNLPLMAPNSLQIIFKHVNEQPKPLEGLKNVDTLEHKIAQMIHKTLEKDPASRYQNCSELLEEIRQIKEGRLQRTPITPSASPEMSESEKRDRWKKSRESATPSPDKVDNETALRIPPADALSISTSAKTPGTTEGISGRDADELRKLTSQRPKPKPITKFDETQKPRSTGKIIVTAVASAAVLAGIILGAPNLQSYLQAKEQVDSFAKAEQSFLQGEGQWSQAKKELLKAQQLAKVQNKQMVVAKIHRYLGHVNLHEGNLATAKEEFEQAIKLINTDDKSMREDYIESLAGLGATYGRQQQSDKAEKNLARARELGAKWEMPPQVMGDVLFATAMVTARDPKKLKEAMSYFDHCIGEYGKVSDLPARTKASALIESAELALRVKLQETAISRAEEAIQVVAKLNDGTEKTEIERRAKPIVALGQPSTASQPTQQNTSVQQAPSMPATASIDLQQQELLNQTKSTQLEQRKDELKLAEEEKRLNDERAAIITRNSKMINDQLKNMSTSARRADKHSYSPTPKGTSVENLQDITNSFVKD